MSKNFDRALTGFIVIGTIAVLAGAWLPQWAQFLVSVSFGKGLVVLGLMLLLKAGMVSFGQGLYYCLGAYTAGILATKFGISDALLLVTSGTLMAALVAFVLGFLMATYRHIFFATLSLAFSMILYGLLVKTSALGSTDGFSLGTPSFFGVKLEAAQAQYALFVLAIVLAVASAFGLQRYLDTPTGRLATAIRDNELRVEYMGASVRKAVHIKYVIAGLLAGLGGALTAITVGHIDPEWAYWTTSGEFVFVTVLSGSASVVAPLLAALVFEGIRMVAYEYSANTWQLTLGVVMLILILFLPGGLASLLVKR